MPLSDEKSPQARKPRTNSRAGVSATRETAEHHGRKSRRAIALGSIEGRIGYHVRRLQVWIFRDFITSLSSLDIRPAQYSVLTVIGANPGLSQTDISTTLGIERSRLVRILDGLEGRGLVLRLRAPNDRRSHALRLTGKGTDILACADFLADEHEARIASQIGIEYENLMTILRDSCAFTRLP